MKAMFFILTFLISLNICYGGVFPQNLPEQIESNDLIINELLSDFPASVESFCDDRIYLKPNSLEVSKEGIFVKDDIKSLFLPIVFSDVSGSYIPVSDYQTLSLIKCIGCGWTRFSGDNCKNRKCPLYGK